MKKKNKYYTVVALVFSALTLNSCADLDTMPDNRTVLDTPSKISGLLTTAYPTVSYMLINELMSDNTDYMGDKNSLGDREGDMMFFWQDDRETGNDSPEKLWMNYNKNVAKANQALASIEELGGAVNSVLKGIKGEALLLRAYNNFLLCNEFCMAYNSKTSAKDMGIDYSTKVEDLRAECDRGNVADVYAKIEQDIEAGIPLINDDYKVVKYHFNKAAAYAFATRFYLYYEKWEKAEQYATMLLGNNPASSFHNLAKLQAMPLSTSEQAVKIGEAYCGADEEANLLIEMSTSISGRALGPWLSYKRYSHTNHNAETEVESATNIWGSKNAVIWEPFIGRQGEADFSAVMKIPSEFEYIDPVAGIGYFHALNVTFNREEALLNRAEAYILQKKYDLAAADLNTWMHYYFNTSKVLTPENIKEYYSAQPYAYSDAQKLSGGFKKHLHPNFTIDEEGSLQESMLQCLLSFRRVETLHQGLRWFDIKRYNIEIPRVLIGKNGKPSKNLDWLKQNDPRMAIQIPSSIVAAGLPANPRN
jgi:hypothetical protein